jgi:hypothetical protein
VLGWPEVGKNIESYGESKGRACLRGMVLPPCKMWRTILEVTHVPEVSCVVRCLFSQPVGTTVEIIGFLVSGAFTAHSISTPIPSMRVQNETYRVSKTTGMAYPITCLDDRKWPIRSFAKTTGKLEKMTGMAYPILC